MQTIDYTEQMNLYCKCMEEIKERIKAIEFIVNKKNYTGSEYTNIEFACLQFRKIFELIVLANLVSNKQEYSKERKNFSSDWNAKGILKTIEKINPSFYPIPSKQVVDSKTKKVIRVDLIKDGYLTKEDLIEGFDDCSQFLHAENPFGNAKDIKAYYPKFKKWLKEIETLLNHHQIQLADIEKQLFVVFRLASTGKTQVALVELTYPQA